MHEVRIARIRRSMERLNVEVLLCKLPENVLYLSGYWPVMGLSLLILPLEGEPTLIIPKAEEEFAREGWVRDVRTYETEKLDEVWDPHKHILRVLKELPVPKGVRVGCELRCESMATNSVVGELNYPGELTFDVIRRAWNATLVDMTDEIMKARMIKTEDELEKMQMANEIAKMGLEAVVERIEEGVKESELAAEAERVVHSEGIGYKGKVRRARGFAFVMSGENSSKAWYPFNFSSDRRVRKGDVILIEYNVCVDGYWTDITRTWVFGEASESQEDMYNTLLEAQEEVCRSIRPGMQAREADKIAREFISRRGYARFFPHRLGHGIGLKIHEPPALHPASKDILQENMVHTVEPGMYTAKFGMRLEDDVVILRKGAKNLTDVPKYLSLKE